MQRMCMRCFATSNNNETINKFSLLLSHSMLKHNKYHIMLKCPTLTTKASLVHKAHAKNSTSRSTCTTTDVQKSAIGPSWWTKGVDRVFTSGQTKPDSNNLGTGSSCKSRFRLCDVFIGSVKGITQCPVEKQCEWRRHIIIAASQWIGYQLAIAWCSSQRLLGLAKGRISFTRSGIQHILTAFSKTRQQWWRFHIVRHCSSDGSVSFSNRDIFS